MLVRRAQCDDVDEILCDNHAGYCHTGLVPENRDPVKIQLPATAEVTAQHITVMLTQQHSGFFNTHADFTHLWPFVPRCVSPPDADTLVDALRRLNQHDCHPRSDIVRDQTRSLRRQIRRREFRLNNGHHSQTKSRDTDMHQACTFSVNAWALSRTPRHDRPGGSRSTPWISGTSATDTGFLETLWRCDGRPGDLVRLRPDGHCGE
jgi:hypothetical protein